MLLVKYHYYIDKQGKKNRKISKKNSNKRVGYINSSKIKHYYIMTILLT